MADEERCTVTLLVDLEGTTTSISFVHEELFPFFLAKLDDVELTDEEVETILGNSSKSALSPKRRKTESTATTDDADPQQQAKEILRSMVERDIKDTTLKSIQGRVWKSGYESGELKGHLYEDVPPVLRALCGDSNSNSESKSETEAESEDLQVQRTMNIYIYSSGSVPAQKLLMKYSLFGDLLPLFKGHFDTRIGLKVEAASYENIYREIYGVEEKDDKKRIVFVTDRVAEADAAAKHSAFDALISIRPGTETLPDDLQYHRVHSFKDVLKYLRETYGY